MKQHLLGKPTLLFSFFLLVSCNDSPSSNHSTDAIRASILITSNDNLTANVNISLNREDSWGTYIDLVDGDLLTVSANGITKHTSKDKSILNAITYRTSFNHHDNNEYVVSFARENGIDAPNSNVVLPFAVGLTQPDKNSEFSIYDSVTFVWSSLDETDKTTMLSFKSSCQLSDGSTKTGNRSETITMREGSSTKTLAINDILPNYLAVSGPDGETILIEPTDTNAIPRVNQCDITILLQRRRQGNLDSAWDGGSIAGIQEREINIKYAAP